MKISVLTPSNRDFKALEIVSKGLMRQSFEDFEWIIGSPKAPEGGLLMEYKHVGDPPKEQDDYWVLNKLYNSMIESAKGELIVSIQDNTFFDPDALEKFWFHYENNPMAIVSGVGDKYLSDQFMNKTWEDPRRRDNGSFYECYFADIEGNFCSVPKEALYSVGGFDEWLDKHAGMDWYSVFARLHIKGEYSFYLDQSNESYSLEHPRYDDWEERNAIHGPYRERADMYKIEPVLDYLRENATAE